MQTILIFIDGMGIGTNNEKINPYITAKTPFLDQLLGQHSFLTNKKMIKRSNCTLYPTDTTLEVAGIPQSA
ncbi:MAG: metalloenzyme, partial [Bacillota bacterium]|nr:metalloenzyme [Bacillota bacterium]